MKIAFEGLHVVVTGGTGELGAAVSAQLLESGAVVHVPTRNADNPGPLAGLRGPTLRFTGGIDLGREDAVQRFYAGLPGLWASIHAVGGFSAAKIEETTGEAFAQMMEQNAASCFLCCREALRAIRRTQATANDKGRIVNVAAMPALEPRRGAGMVAYTASKAAVAAITTALGEEVAKEGIWVNAVAPSIMDTRANRAAMPRADFASWAKVEDVARTICFLASPQNLAARGGIVPVYGRS